jgi:hypothetical protein
VESGFKDENGNQLAHEIEKYDETTDNDLIAWVRVPRLSYTGDTVITIHYGNDDIGTATANPAGVWDSNFTGVWHLNEDVTDEQTSGTHDDSTGANVGSQNGNVEGTGKFADGQDFDGLTYANADYIDTGTSPGSATDLTVSYWMKAEVNNAYMRALGKFALNDAGDQGWNFLVRPSEETGYDRALIFRIGDFGAYGFWGNEITAEQLYDAGQWVHVVGTFAYNGSAGGTGTLYVDGSQVASKSNTDNRGVANTATPFLIGWDSSIQGGGEDFNGIIDEVRISDSVRDLCAGSKPSSPTSANQGLIRAAPAPFMASAPKWPLPPPSACFPLRPPAKTIRCRWPGRRPPRPAILAFPCTGPTAPPVPIAGSRTSSLPG